MPRGRPPKPAAEKLGDALQVRLTAADRELVKRAAAGAALEESVWIRDRVVRAARAELEPDTTVPPASR